MAYFIKIIIAVLVIVLVTELSKKDTKLAALLLALPIISFTAYTMIWFETKDIEKSISELIDEKTSSQFAGLPLRSVPRGAALRR